MKTKHILLHIAALLLFASFFHEIAHVITGTLLGWQVEGIFFTPFVRWVQFKPLDYNPNVWERIAVYGSGSLVEFIIASWILYVLSKNWDYKVFTGRERLWIYLELLWALPYGIWETIVLGLLAW